MTDPHKSSGGTNFPQKEKREESAQMPRQNSWQYLTQPPRDLQAQGELADRARHAGHDV